MKKFTTLILTTLLTLSLAACTKTNPNDDRSNDPADPVNTQTPYSQGPTEGPGNMKGPTSPPPISATDATAEELAEIERTHQTIDTTFTDEKGSHEVTLTFNIDEDEVKGIMIQPRFKEEPDVTNYRNLANQVVFKKIDEIDIQPIPEMQEFSDAFISSFDQALKMYHQKNPS